MRIPSFIKRLAKVCNRDSSRFALGGIKCESDGKIARLTATDGHILATVHWKDDDGVAIDTIVDARQLSSLPAKAFMHPKGVAFDGSTMRATVGPDKTQTPVESVSGTYPKYEQVLRIHDEPDGYVAVTVDAALLSTLCDLSHDMDRDSQSRGITLFVKDAQSCVYACCASTDGHVARMAIMPRAADEPADAPTFPERPGVKAKPVKAKPPVEDYIDLDSIVIPA
ncbi:MAG: hypothetical protein EBR88_00050 [Betaproteobacteria bacterium]|nr:hypothetical protein [Betaproteobacteria bacterium]